MKPLRDLFLGFVKLHILHHAGRKPVFGLWLIEELAQHGYRLSPGTLYPILHSLEQDSLLSSASQVVDGKIRKYYQLTSTGREALAQGREQAAKLLRELGEE